MHRMKNYIIILFFTSLNILFLFNITVNALELPKVQRLAGANRYETNGAICEYGWEKSEYAIISSGNDFPDALCAAPLAYKYKAPILLTEKDNLNSNIEKQLNKLGVKKAFIIGGENVVSPNIEKRLKELQISVERISGNSRYETSVMIAEKVGAKGEVVIACGEDFPDALSIASIAAKCSMPILLTPKSNATKELIAFLNKNNPSEIYVLGGESVISKNVFSELKNPKRIFGNNRYETNIEILKKFSNKVSNKNTYVTSGEDFPDALSSAALASINSSVIVLADKEINENTKEFILNAIKDTQKFVVIGGYAAIPDRVLNRIYGEAGAYSSINTRKYIMEKIITLKNTGNTLVTNVEAEIDLGKINQSINQREEQIEVYGPGISMVNEGIKNNKAIVNLPYLKAGQSVEYRIQRKFLNSGIKYNVNLADTYSDYRGFSEYQKYTSSEKKIESDDLLIRSKAKEIIGSETNAYLKAKMIFEYVNTSLIYDYSEANKGALNALITKKGVCEDYADLFSAMCRAVGIPTRIVYGFWVPLENISSTPFETLWYRHAWAEFYIPEYGWVIAEPTKQINDSTGRLVPALDYMANLPSGDHFAEGYTNDPAYKYSYYGTSELTIQEEPYIKEIKN